MKYNWRRDIEPHLNALEDAAGGFTAAKRGVVTIGDGTKVFVKIAVDELTRKWLKKEIRAYKKLNRLGYQLRPSYYLLKMIWRPSRLNIWMERVLRTLGIAIS
jgi:hypothetical protein